MGQYYYCNSTINSTYLSGIIRAISSWDQSPKFYFQQTTYLDGSSSVEFKRLYSTMDKWQVLEGYTTVRTIWGVLDPPFTCDWTKCDIELNEYFLKRNQNFIQETAAHEMGHAMGLAHTYNRNTLMYPDSTRLVMTPQQDEFNGIAYIFNIIILITKSIYGGSKMRKVASIIIIISLLSCLFSCGQRSNTSNLITQKPEKILLKESGQGSFVEDFSTLDKLVMHADLIVSGTIETISYMQYVEGRDFSSHATLKVNQVFYGENLDTVDFLSTAGYVPINEYEKKLEIDGDLQGFKAMYSEAQRKDSFIRKSFANENLLMPGDSCILFLRKQIDNSYFPVGVISGTMKINGEYASQTIDGKEYKAEEVIIYISNIDKANKPLCVDCEQREKEAEEYLKTKKD